MNIKGIFSNLSPFRQMLILLSLLIIGAILAAFIGIEIFHSLYGQNAQLTFYPDAMRWFQLLSSLFTFLFPALGAAWLFSNHPSRYLFLTKLPSLDILGMVFLSMLLISPTITLTGYLNKTLLKFPSFLSSLEDWLITQENNAEELTLLMLGNGDVYTLISNLVVIALGAAITEEFLFRGAIFRLLQKFSMKKISVIWVSAIIFSAFHMQFFGFIPRLLLGAWFGYLIVWSQNIWIPVFAHFCNNAMAVILMSDSHMKDSDFVTGDISSQSLLPYSIMTVISIPLFILCARYIKNHLNNIIKD